MPKVKLPRSSPSIDMTPMVDLAFLLVTFFMLTTKFRADEAVAVTIPASVSQTKVSDFATTITIDSAGRVFYDMDGKDLRIKLITDISKNFPTQFGGALSDEDINRFSVMGAFGVPFAQMKAYVEGGEAQRKVMNTATKGIPLDSIPLDELDQWVRYGWNATLTDWSAKKAKNPKQEYPSFNIKADGNAKYKVIKRVVDICRDANIQHFDLITSLKMKAQ
jgi:biopolymer transport protein ExbD